MNAYHKYQFSLLIVVILFGSVVLGCQNKIQEKPNVLFIAVDDLNDLDSIAHMSLSLLQFASLKSSPSMILNFLMLNLMTGKIFLSMLKN